MAKIIKVKPNMVDTDRKSPNIYVSVDGIVYMGSESMNFGSGRAYAYREKGRIISSSLERGLFAMAMACGDVWHGNGFSSEENPDFIKDCISIMDIIRKNNENVKTLHIYGIPEEFFVNEEHANAIFNVFRGYGKDVKIGATSFKIKKMYERFLKEEGISVEEFIQNDSYIVVTMKDKMWYKLLRHGILDSECIEKVYNED